MPKKKVEPKRVLVLRTCDKNMKSFGGFQWPKSGRVEAPDWKPTKECGNGLHGLKEGRGDGSYLSWEESAIWQAVWVQEDLILEFDGKCKFPWCEVACVGDRKTVTDFMAANGCVEGVVGGTATAGDGGTATAGDWGTATAGDWGTATAGEGGTATAGYGGILNILYWNGKRYRVAVFYVGEDGIEPNVAYGADESGKPIKKEK